MNQTVLNAFYDELEKIAAGLMDTLQQSGQPSAGNGYKTVQYDRRVPKELGGVMDRLNSTKGATDHATKAWREQSLKRLASKHNSLSRKIAAPELPSTMMGTILEGGRRNAKQVFSSLFR